MGGIRNRRVSGTDDPEGMEGKKRVWLVEEAEQLIETFALVRRHPIKPEQILQQS